MVESFPSPGIDPPSPTLSSRLGELAAYLAAPATGRLTDEQRALSLGIARRLVSDVALRLGSGIDTDALWQHWLRGGLPSADRLAPACFARAEEHRWREQSAQRGGALPVATDAPETDAAIDETPSDRDLAYLALRIADRRRFDVLGNPALAVADLDDGLFRALLLDIAAWRLDQVSGDQALAAELGDAVRAATEGHADKRGIDRAAARYHDSLGAELPEVAGDAIARHDWPALIALSAAALRRSYGDTALILLTAEIAALPSRLAPLRLDRAALAPLEVSLAMLPARAVDHPSEGGEG